MPALVRFALQFAKAPTRSTPKSRSHRSTKSWIENAVRVPSGRIDESHTSCCGAPYGSGRRTTAFKTLNIATEEPMAMVRTATSSAVKIG